MSDLERERKITKSRYISFAVFTVLTLLWMGVIFGFSERNAEESTVQSNAVTEIIVRIIQDDFDELSEAKQQEIIDEYDGIVRKTAHFAAYAFLGFLAYCAAGSLKLLPKKKYKPLMFSIPVCVIFAISDELHQTGVEGRAGRFTDVLIDSGGVVAGSAFAIFSVMLVCRYIMRQNRAK